MHGLKSPRPYLDEDGRLRIPIDTDPKYRWWEEGGQDVWDTMIELEVPEKERLRVFRLYARENLPSNPNCRYVRIYFDPQCGVTVTHNVELPEQLKNAKALGQIARGYRLRYRSN